MIPNANLRCLRRRIQVSFGWTLVVPITFFATSLTIAAERPVQKGSDVSVEEQMRMDVQFLASEEMRGRDVAGETIHEAADYIANRMQGIGADITTVDGSALQIVDVALEARPGPAANNQAVFQFGADQAAMEIVAKLGVDMNPLSAGAVQGEAVGNVHFVGYGITAPKLKYDDYSGINAKGSIVILLRKEPGATDPNSPFDGIRNTRHAYFATKIANAIRHNAAAVMIVNDQGSINEATRIVRFRINQEQERATRLSAELKALPKEAVNSRNTFQMKLDGALASLKSLQLELQRSERGLLGISAAGGPVPADKQIPVVSISRQLADQLLRQSAGQSLDDAEAQINDTLRPNSFSLTATSCTLKSQLEPTSAKSSNVIGVIKGKGPLANDSVVIGAHYDHVGMGGFGSLAPGTVAIHNGADDNASGVASMLAAGRILKRNLDKLPSHRRIVLIGFTGEERGLVGSKHYVENPVFPLGTTAAMINLDMVGRLRDNELTVYGTGSGEGIDEMLEVANKTQAFDLFKIPSGFGPSDHQSFYKGGVPVLFFFTGLHNDYHRPSDDLDKLNYDGMLRITDIVADVAHRLAVQPQRPVYAETENRVQIRRQLTAYLGVSLSDQGDHVVLSGVTANGPASQSGLRIGDQLNRFGKRRIRTSNDVFELLRGRSPDSNLKVEILRRGQLMVFDVKLGKRP